MLAFMLLALGPPRARALAVIPGTSSPTRPRFAVLVDAENTQHRAMASIVGEIATFGDATIRRCYGDFTNEALGPWKPVGLELSFRRINADSYAKGRAPRTRS